MYNWVTLLYRRNQHNVVNQICFSEISFKREKEEDNIVTYNFPMFSSASSTEEVLKKVSLVWML